jgi:hypothetical protein
MGIKAAKKTPKPKAGCGCLKTIDERLRADYGATFKKGLTMNFDTMQAGIAGPFLAIEWITTVRTNRKLPTIECAFCPFCGKKKP